MARYLITAYGCPGYKWEGAQTYRVSCRLETEATSKEEAITKWHASFSEAEKATVDLELLKAYDIDTELQTHIPYYQEGRAIYWDGNNTQDHYRRLP